MWLGGWAPAPRRQVPGLVPSTAGVTRRCWWEVPSFPVPDEQYTLLFHLILHSFFKPLESMRKHCFAVLSAFKMRGFYCYTSEVIYVFMERSEATAQKELTQNTQHGFVKCSRTYGVSSRSPGRGCMLEISWVEAPSILFRYERQDWPGKAREVVM